MRALRNFGNNLPGNKPTTQTPSAPPGTGGGMPLPNTRPSSGGGGFTNAIRKAATPPTPAPQAPGNTSGFTNAMRKAAKPGMKKGGKVKKMATGGSTSRRADGIAQRGKTNCKMV